MEESVSDNLEHPETSKDSDTKVGHKKTDTSFRGYRTHIAMTEERIITAATVTSVEKADGNAGGNGNICSKSETNYKIDK